jgi:hypothetical protein
MDVTKPAITFKGEPITVDHTVLDGFGIPMNLGYLNGNGSVAGTKITWEIPTQSAGTLSAEFGRTNGWQSIMTGQDTDLYYYGKIYQPYTVQTQVSPLPDSTPNTLAPTIQTGSPQTGDNAPLASVLACSAISLLCIGALLLARKRFGFGRGQK